MHLRLTGAERALVEQYMPLVTRVMKDCVHGPTGIYDWNDLFQFGCVGLCKAAAAYEEGRKAVFETYAYVLIRNEIFNALEYATRRKQREVCVDMDAMPVEDVTGAEPGSDLADLLDAAAGSVSGVTAKGIEAIRLQAQGYSCKEIGQLCFGGVSDNNVSAWVSRARKYLRQDPTIAAFAP